VDESLILPTKTDRPVSEQVVVPSLFELQSLVEASALVPFCVNVASPPPVVSAATEPTDRTRSATTAADTSPNR
jgi:hypothetical protein